VSKISVPLTQYQSELGIDEIEEPFTLLYLSERKTLYTNLI
jgi:hypothetical protein